MKKENSRESASIFEKKSLGLLKRKKTHLHRNVKRINWWEGQKIKKQLFFAEKNEIRKPKRGRKIVNRAFVLWSVARFCGSISLSVMLRERLILTEENYRIDLNINPTNQREDSSQIFKKPWLISITTTTFLRHSPENATPKKSNSGNLVFKSEY